MNNIAIIAGGDSSEYDVSVKSAASVASALRELKYEVKIIYLSNNQWVSETKELVDKNDFSYVSSLDGAKHLFDYALIMIHGTPGENGILQGYFELIGMPYSGCSVEVSAITFNKSLTKQIVAQIEGLNLATQITINKNQSYNTNQIIEHLNLPLFVKPNASGSSCGVTKVKQTKELSAAIETAHHESTTALLEEFIEGMEISQGVMIVGDKEYVLPITELIPQNDFFDYDAKYTNGVTQEITPARLSSEIAAKISNISLEAYKKLGCRGIARFDYIVKNNNPYFIEVNTNPGMSPNSIVPQQWKQIGLSMGQAWSMIIQNDLKLTKK